MTIRSICVFCGSGNGTDPRFLSAAETLGRLMAESGLRLVYGGGANGLMGRWRARSSSMAGMSRVSSPTS